MSSRAKLGGICLLSYAIGVLLSPYLLPADFFTGIIIGPFFTANDNDAASSSKKSSFEKAVLEAQLKYAETYKQIIMGGNNDHDNHDDPFHDVDIVLHRNGQTITTTTTTTKIHRPSCSVHYPNPSFIPLNVSRHKFPSTPNMIWMRYSHMHLQWKRNHP